MARINVEIPDEVRKLLKAQLALEGRTIKDWLLEEVESYLGQSKPAAVRWNRPAKRAKAPSKKKAR